MAHGGGQLPGASYRPVHPAHCPPFGPRTQHWSVPTASKPTIHGFPWQPALWCHRGLNQRFLPRIGSKYKLQAADFYIRCVFSCLFIEALNSCLLTIVTCLLYLSHHCLIFETLQHNALLKAVQTHLHGYHLCFQIKSVLFLGGGAS